MNHRVLDLVVGAGAAWQILDHPRALDRVPVAAWPTWYQTLAGAAAGLLGIGTVAVTLLYTVTTSARLVEVRHRLGGSLQGQFLSCMTIWLIALAGFCSLYAIERATHRALHDGLLVGLMALCALRAARLFWLFNRVVLVLAADVPGQPTPEPRAPWVPPVIPTDAYAREPRTSTRPVAGGQ